MAATEVSSVVTLTVSEMLAIGDKSVDGEFRLISTPNSTAPGSTAAVNCMLRVPSTVVTPTSTLAQKETSHT